MITDLQNRGSQVQVLSPLLREAPAHVDNPTVRALPRSGPKSALVTDSSPNRVRDDLPPGLRRRARITLAATILAGIAAIIVGALNPPAAGAAPAQRSVLAPCLLQPLTATEAIDCIWPISSRRAAHRIAECESTASAPERIAKRRGLGRWARNGQYVGIFQMGFHERRAHGWYRRGSSARAQVLSAYSLYRSRGWQPWTCRP